MAKCYFELRGPSAKGTDSVVADIMRHLHARQHVGKAVVICEQPATALAAARKQWLKLSRVIQRQRASTLNADKILKYTHTITHMQHMHFTAKTPLEEPEADVYFLDKSSCGTMPAHCYSAYFSLSIPLYKAKDMIEQLPAEALVIDYRRQMQWAKLGLQSKVVLEAQVASEWRQVRRFLKSNDIDVSNFIQDGIHNIEVIDDALDTLLGISHRFLRIANEFQRALELARPLRIGRSLRQDYDFLVLMAYRVQALSPGTFTQHFLESYNEDDTFFLHDIARRRWLIGGGEPLAESFRRQMAAGRHNLARALQYAYSLPPGRRANDALGAYPARLPMI